MCVATRRPRSNVRLSGCWDLPWHRRAACASTSIVAVLLHLRFPWRGLGNLVPPLCFPSALILRSFVYSSVSTDPLPSYARHAQGLCFTFSSLTVWRWAVPDPVSAGYCPTFWADGAALGFCWVNVPLCVAKPRNRISCECGSQATTA